MHGFPNTSSIREIQKRIADLARKREVLRKDDPELLELEVMLLDARPAARTGRRRREAHSGYDPLCEFLRNAPEKTIHLQFHQIEVILGRPLPIIASWCESWWEGGGYAVKYVQCKAWQDAGRVARVNLGQRTVEFISEG